MIEDLLIKDVILCITRMMNPSKASWGDPANLATLLIDLAAYKQTALVKRLTAIRDRIKPIGDGLKRWRDEHLSKNDYAAYVGMKADIDALPANNRKMIEDVLSAMGEVLGNSRRTTAASRSCPRMSASPATSTNSWATSVELETLRAKSSG